MINTKNKISSIKSMAIAFYAVSSAMILMVSLSKGAFAENITNFTDFGTMFGIAKQIDCTLEDVRLPSGVYKDYAGKGYSVKSAKEEAIARCKEENPSQVCYEAANAKEMNCPVFNNDPYKLGREMYRHNDDNVYDDSSSSDVTGVINIFSF